MADIKAISILSEQISAFGRIQNPPRSLDAVESYDSSVRKVLKGASGAVSEVKSYIETVEGKIKELRNAQMAIIKKNQDAIKTLFAMYLPGIGELPNESSRKKLQLTNKLQTSHGSSLEKIQLDYKLQKTSQESSLEKIQLAHKLQKKSQEIMNDRLEELMKETEIVCAKMKDGTGVVYDDTENLRGCLQSWIDAKVNSFEEEKRIQLEQQKKREEEKRMRRKREEQEQREREDKKRKEEDERKRRENEEDERRAEDERRRLEEQKRTEEEEKMRRERAAREKREREEKRMKEEEERKRRQQEEAERKVEVERRRKEEEEKRRIEEELRRKTEEEERIKHEEEEKRIRLEEERKRREDEAIRKKEEERQRIDAERRERERIKKEAEEKAWRQDPNNWNPVTYSRDCDEVDGKLAYHGGIKCVMAAPPDSIDKDDIECCASDEVDSVIETLETDEKPVSSIIDIHSTKGILHSEVPTRIYIPHYSGFCTSDETVVKISVNQTDWITVSPIQSTSNMEEQDRVSKRLAGVEVNDFSSLKAIVVTRPRCQTIIVDKPGISVQSTMDKNVKLFVPRKTFGSRTELKLMIQSVPEHTLASLVKENHELENILAVNSVVTLICEKPPTKAIEVDLMKTSHNRNIGKFQRSKSYQLYTAKDKIWKFADVEFKGHQDDLTVMLPAGREKYTIMELDVPSFYSKENVPSIAKALHTSINKTVVVMIARQHENDLNKCAVRIVKRDIHKETLAYLTDTGYTEGPGSSAEFRLQEGQEIDIRCTGNIDNITEADGQRKYTYMSYLDGVAVDMKLRVKDFWKQKDLPSYVGAIRCAVLRKAVTSDLSFSCSVELTICIPKPERHRTAIGVAPVRFPYYLTSLASYLSEILCKEDKDIWQEVLRSLIGYSKFSSKHRIAKRKFVGNDVKPVCRAMLLDWMKEQAVHEDKLQHITTALIHNGHGDKAELCTDFVRYQKEHLSDAVISDLAQGITKDVHNLGQDLGLDSKQINTCIKPHANDIKSQCIALMMEWRESDQVTKHGDNALKYLRNVCD